MMTSPMMMPDEIIKSYASRSPERKKEGKKEREKEGKKEGKKERKKELSMRQRAITIF